MGHFFTLSSVLLLPFLVSSLSEKDSSPQVVLDQPDDPTPCRVFPGDNLWPKRSEWQEFNRTLGGKLIATVPLAAPCHDSEFGPYDEEKCSALRDVWFLPGTHLHSPGSVMAPFFTNNSCNPFLPPEAPCTLGGLVSYSVNATTAADYQETIKFTRHHNIRLVIKNTGHDYNGKSTGAGAVALWTQHLKRIDLVNYHSAHYNGKALKMDAGVLVGEAYEFAENHDILVVGGNGATVGMVGGFIQGGGHGPLASNFGLAADQVLEWEVVTGAGDYLVASPDRNSDLYWALRGGGGGTFAAVLSATVKTYPAKKASAATLSFPNLGTNADQFYEAVEVFVKGLPDLVDAGVVANMVILPNAFAMLPASATGVTKERLDKLLQPTIDKLKENEIPHLYQSEQFDSFYSSFKAMSQQWNVSDAQLGGRLIPRSIVAEDPAGFTRTIRKISELGAIFVGVSLNVAHGVKDTSEVAAHPFWRETIMNAVLGVPYNYTDWDTNIAMRAHLTQTLLPELEKLTPDGGAIYLSESDPQTKEFREPFYGSHYDELEKVKTKYDPADIFYALGAVGSDRWVEGPDGRLCKSGPVEPASSKASSVEQHDEL
ncbi:FAD-binding domain-containing protein [Patellaria atrata CBS 101060]|uniref:FAD-binding domain-containing protein n=1 Tax=Patellaria atrata CBS 101060 TaxID=1346257 RepID=A0A9P4SE20_9PEZI|nr:FAD-binding domain-containing protein [Patellaria atrata CBS 101060]